MSEQMYHLHQDGYQITAKDQPISAAHIEHYHGGMKKLNAAGIIAKPANSKIEKIKVLKKQLLDALSFNKLNIRKDKLLKATVDSNKAFLDISELEYQQEEGQDDEGQGQEEGQEEAEQEDQQEEQRDPNQAGEEGQEEGEAASEAEGEESPPIGDTNPDSGSDQEAGLPPGQEAEPAEQDVQQDVQQDSPEDIQEVDSDKLSPEEVTEHLKNEGYSEAEIKYIMHGGVPYMESKDDHAADNELEDGKLDRGHQDAMNTIEQTKASAEIPDSGDIKNHAKAMMDHELSTAKYDKYSKQTDLKHKEDVLAMEREFDRKSRELDLKYQELELKQKLHHTNTEHSNKESHKTNINRIKASQSKDASKTSQKEKEGK